MGVAVHFKPALLKSTSVAHLMAGSHVGPGGKGICKQLKGVLPLSPGLHDGGLHRGEAELRDLSEAGASVRGVNSL